MGTVVCAACGAERGDETICPVCGTRFDGGALAPVEAANETPPPAPIEDRSLRAPVDAGPGLLGIVRGLRERTEQDENQRPRYVVTFRLERHDKDGVALQPIPVQMDGRRFDGVIQDGDWVELSSPWHPGQTLEPRSVRNLSTGSDFAARTDSRIVKSVRTALGVLVLGWIAVIFFFVIRAILSNHAF